MTTSTIVSLGTARMDRERDCRAWKPVEAVRQLLADIESGVIDPDMIYIAMRAPAGDGSSSFPFVQAGMIDIETVGLLSQHLHFRLMPS